MAQDIYESAIGWKYKPFSQEDPQDVAVTNGVSWKCPVYVQRTPPCTNGCPAGEDIRGYNNILRGLRKYEDPLAEAWRLITEVNPFPAIMGRACPAPCQDSCYRNNVDDTVGINAIERVIGDYAIEKGLAFEKPEKPTGKKIAVVGSGVAGLSCAYQLARRGHRVVVFEGHEELGGMMRYGLPSYRLSREVIDAEIRRILDLGVEVKTRTRVGTDVSFESLRKEYDAVFLGLGAHSGSKLDIQGKDAKGVQDGVDYLTRINQGEAGEDAIRPGEKVLVLVIGGGNTAIDVARVSLRQGAEVTVVYRRTQKEMPAIAHEVEAAKAEGVKFEFLAAPKEIVHKDGKVIALRCYRMELGQPDKSGRRQPVPVPNSDYDIPAQRVIYAIGQNPDLRGLDAVNTGKPWLEVDPHFQVKGMEGVFTGGDTLGLGLLTTAIGHGRKAAEAIHTYVLGLPLPKPARSEIVDYKRQFSVHFLPKPRNKPPEARVENIIGNYDEIVPAITREQSKKEAERCMSCGLCFECDNCMIYCPQEAITKDKKKPIGQVMFTIYEKCVGCHICAEVCPCGYIDMGMGVGL